MSTITIAVFAFCIVFVGMLILMGVTEILRRLSTPPRVAEGPGGAGQLDARLLVVLAAAVAEALGPRARIHHVHVHRGEADRWSRAGRMDVMVSHRVGTSR